LKSGEFTSDGGHFVAYAPTRSDQSARVLLYDLATGRLVADLAHNGFVTKSPSQRDPIFVTVSGGAMRVWNATNGREVGRLDHARASSAVFSRDGGFLATGGYDGTLRVWNARTLREEARRVRDGPVTALGFSHDGRFLLSGVTAPGEARPDTSVELWRPED